MSDEVQHKPFEWADQMFSRTPDVAPKYRDLLAMLAMSLMGNGEAAQHFYAKAVVDGASDDELRRATDVAKIARMDIGDLSANVQRAVEDIRAEHDKTQGADETPINPN